MRTEIHSGSEDPGVENIYQRINQALQAYHDHRFIPAKVIILGCDEKVHLEASFDQIMNQNGLQGLLTLEIDSANHAVSYNGFEIYFDTVAKTRISCFS